MNWIGPLRNSYNLASPIQLIVDELALAMPGGGGRTVGEQFELIQMHLAQPG